MIPLNAGTAVYNLDNVIAASKFAGGYYILTFPAPIGAVQISDAPTVQRIDNWMLANAGGIPIAPSPILTLPPQP